MNATIYLDRNRAHWIVTGKQAKPKLIVILWLAIKLTLVAIDLGFF